MTNQSPRNVSKNYFKETKKLSPCDMLCLLLKSFFAFVKVQNSCFIILEYCQLDLDFWQCTCRSRAARCGHMLQCTCRSRAARCGHMLQCTCRSSAAWCGHMLQCTGRSSGAHVSIWQCTCRSMVRHTHSATTPSTTR